MVNEYGTTSLWHLAIGLRYGIRDAYPNSL